VEAQGSKTQERRPWRRARRPGTHPEEGWTAREDLWSVARLDEGRRRKTAKRASRPATTLRPRPSAGREQRTPELLLLVRRRLWSGR